MFYKDLVKVLGLLILEIIKQLFLKLKVITVRLLSSHLKVQQQVLAGFYVMSFQWERNQLHP